VGLPLSTSAFSEEQIRAFVQSNPAEAAELLRRLEATEKPEERPYIKGLHRSQRDFVMSTEKRRAALCSRRAGKTFGLCAWLLQGAEEAPGEVSVYIALSRNNARMAAWKTFEILNQRHKLGLKFSEKDNQLWVKCKNGHAIWLAGCKDAAEVEKFRGNFYKRVVIDEAASYGDYLETLIEDVLDPALVDLDGDLALIGTPGALPRGYFFEVTAGDKYGEIPRAQWPTFNWNLLKNPYIPRMKTPEAEQDEFEASEEPDYVNLRGKKWLEEKKLRNGWDDDHPTYQREYLGRWVRDEGALVYPFDGMRNAFYDLPEGPGTWRYGLGIDCGYEDSSAFVVVAYRIGFPELYVVHAEKRKKLIPSAMAAHVERLKKTYKFSQMVIDSGGLGKAYQMEMTNRYGMFCEPAKKNNKRAYIEVIRGELLSGMVKVHPQGGACLIEEWSRLIWNEDRDAPSEDYEDHASDGALYILRAIITSYRPDVERTALTKEQRLAVEASNAKLEMIAKMAKLNRKKSRFSEVLKRIAEGR
jgi:hypothetical protein